MENFPRSHGPLACIFDLVLLPVVGSSVQLRGSRLRMGSGPEAGKSLEFRCSCRLRFGGPRPARLGSAADEETGLETMQHVAAYSSRVSSP